MTNKVHGYSLHCSTQSASTFYLAGSLWMRVCDRWTPVWFRPSFPVPGQFVPIGLGGDACYVPFLYIFHNSEYYSSTSWSFVYSTIYPHYCNYIYVLPRHKNYILWCPSSPVFRISVDEVPYYPTGKSKFMMFNFFVQRKLWEPSSCAPRRLWWTIFMYVVIFRKWWYFKFS